MKAIQASAAGAPDVLELVDVPVPVPGPGQILLRVEAAAVNFSDAHRRAARPYPFPTAFPYTPGSEVAGVVEALGEGVQGPPVGTPVFALVGADGSGGYAEYAVANAPSVVPIPDGLSADVASGMIVAGSTAVLALETVGRVQSGERVLIEAAGGGVGVLATQLAVLLGAEVIASAGSAAAQEAAKAAGASVVVDSRSPQWADEVSGAVGDRGIDVALVSSGGDRLSALAPLLAPFGRVIVLGSASGEPLQLSEVSLQHLLIAPALNVSVHAFNLGIWFGLRPADAGAALGRAIDLVASRSLTPVVGHVLPLADAAAAHRLMESRTHVGKIVLRP